jgi:quercetin dioxygenase-like cupin family protein
MRFALIGSILLIAGASQDRGGSTAEIQIRPSDVKWADGPDSLPKGCQFAVLSGDPAKEGPFVMRLKLPADYKIMPHSHPANEHVTVLSGSFFITRGDAFDAQKGKELPAGSYALMPKGSNHFAFCKGETILQLNNIGPWAITYANPADDPRKK